MNRFTSLVSSAAVAAMFAAAPAAAQSVRDFQLPPSPDETEEAQGPVDPEAPAPVRPRVIATPTPSPVRQPAPQPQVTQTPLTVPTATPTPSSRPTPTVRAPVQQEERTAPAAAQTGSPAPSEVSPQENVPAETAGEPAVSSPPPSASPSASSAEQPEAQAEEDTLHWWLLAVVGLIAAGAAMLLRRRRGRVSVPTIERPKVKSERAEADAQPAAAPRQPLSVKAEAVKLTRSFANITLDYRLTLLNRTDRALKDVEIAAKLVSAHNTLPMEQQIADAVTPLPEAAKVERLSPGQSRQIEGKLVLPVGEVYAIRQGSAALMVPILQLRASAPGIAPLVRSLVVGQVGMGSDRLQPFRLDEGPRSFAPLSQRALD